MQFVSPQNLYHWVLKRRSQAAPWHGAWWQRLTVDRVCIDCGLALCSHGGHGGHGASARPGVWTWQVKDSHGKWPIYRWFTWVYLLKMVIFHGYVK